MKDQFQVFNCDGLFILKFTSNAAITVFSTWWPIWSIYLFVCPIEEEKEEASKN